MEEKIFEIRIVKSDDDYIIVEGNKSREYIDAMYTWYVYHVEFFNGSIQLWDDEKCLTKTNGVQSNINFEECKNLHNEVSASLECEQCSKKDECFESEV